MGFFAGWVNRPRGNSALRPARYLYAAAAIHCLPLTGQIAEPILAHSALPLSAGAGALKLDYAREQGRSGADAEVIPEVMLETGVGRGLEAILRFPLLRFKEGFELPTNLGGGQLAIGSAVPDSGRRRPTLCCVGASCR